MPKGIYKKTKEHIEKIAQSKKDKPSWNKGLHINIGEKNPFWGKHHTKESKKKMSDANKGKRYSPATEFKVGHTPPHKKPFRTSHGYISIFDKRRNKYIKRCRLVMEKHIGRYLASDEIIHHKNWIKNDDRLENLTMCTREEHLRFYHPKIK